MSDMIRIGGLWEGRDKNGQPYFSGRLTATSRLLVFRNSFTEGQNPPDYIAYLAPVEKKESDDG